MLEHVPAGSEVWCIPFDHLTEFYLGFGMQRITDLERVPASVREKLDWCAGNWTQGSCVGTQLLRWVGTDEKPRGRGVTRATASEDCVTDGPSCRPRIVDDP